MWHQAKQVPSYLTCMKYRITFAARLQVSYLLHPIYCLSCLLNNIIYYNYDSFQHRFLYSLIVFVLISSNLSKKQTIKREQIMNSYREGVFIISHSHGGSL